MPVTRCYQMLQLCIAKSTLKVITVLHLLETRTEELILLKSEEKTGWSNFSN